MKATLQTGTNNVGKRGYGRNLVFSRGSSVRPGMREEFELAGMCVLVI